MSIKDQYFGIEIEMSGLTRRTAAKIIAKYFETDIMSEDNTFVEYSVRDKEMRKWKVVYDSSIDSKRDNEIIYNSAYKVEVVSPICEYKDIEDIQEIIRHLREDGNASVDKSCGIHVHVDASKHDARSLRNITNIMYSKEEMIYKALQINVSRENQYCQKINAGFLNDMNESKPSSLNEVKEIWYQGHMNRSYNHFDDSRYHALNLHSVFEKGTIEFRLFNGTLHAGEIKSYIQFCLAISNQALSQAKASRKKTYSDNEKYTFRTWLLRLGMIGDEFKTARYHLLKHLDGCIAWKDPAQAEAQKERLRIVRENEEEMNIDQSIENEGLTMM